MTTSHKIKIEDSGIITSGLQEHLEVSPYHGFDVEVKALLHFQSVVSLRDYGIDSIGHSFIKLDLEIGYQEYTVYDEEKDDFLEMSIDLTDYKWDVSNDIKSDEFGSFVPSEIQVDFINKEITIS